ncbi:MAG: alpha-1,3-galactosidase B [Kiritimatiellaeota bacterium]|nr:alpha-1,3-galactosidase B [Kiritimatiellota bacterium]
MAVLMGCGGPAAAGAPPSLDGPRREVFNSAQAGKVIQVTDFGVKPDSKDDAVKGVRAALEACRKAAAVTLVFPKGRYDFWPEHSEKIEYYESNTTDNNPKICPVVLRGLKGLTIEGQGSEFVCHGRMQPLTLEDCVGVTVRNLNIDWDIPFVAQAKIVRVENTSIDIKINPIESPYKIEGGKIVFHGEGWKSRWCGCMEFEADTRFIPKQSGDSPLGGNWGKYIAQELGDGLVRLNLDFERKPKAGNILIMRHSARDHAGVFILNCKDTVFESVNLFTSACLGILGQFSENITLKKTNVTPNYAKKRYQCGHADGFHVSNCRGKVLVDGCKFEGLMDDPINVHGTSVKIIEVKDGNRVRCQFMEGMSTGMTWGRTGERVGFLDPKSMATIGQGAIKSYARIDRDRFEVEFAAAVPAGLKAGDALENLTWAPDFTVRNTMFGSCRARGLLVSTPGKVVIENNDFISSGAAILIAGDANEWYESGAVRDVLIRGNRFHPSCLTSWYQFGEGIISILPIISTLDPEHPFHRNIRIEGNQFDVFDCSVVYALSVDGLSFKDNTIQHHTQYQPWQGRQAMLTFEGCKHVVVAGNRIAADALGKNISIVKMNPAEVTVAPGQGVRVGAAQ